jgi:hypothetical protein
MVKLKMGTQYRFFPWVHVSRLKLRAEHPDRPTLRCEELPEDDNLDAALLPEDSWEADEEGGEFEVEAILDVDWQKNGSYCPQDEAIPHQVARVRRT